ncbi:MAG: ABC-type dipeptide/oligopeptide/nickel transport system permease component [Alphaproteobacteria bacterium]|jgi:ABC-type dipeptide/oligopeptide/nickel transport system permease component
MLALVYLSCNLNLTILNLSCYIISNNNKHKLDTNQMLAFLTFFFKRLLLIIPTALGVVTLTFFLIHLVPGDPVEVLLGEHALPADRQALTESLGLHLPLFEQFKVFVWGVIQFDFGTSFYSGKEVVSLIGSRLGATVQLALAAILFAISLAVPLGLWAALHKNKWQDRLALTFSMLAFSMPSFWLGPLMMIFFSLYLGLLPVSGNEQLSSIVLPAITLGMAMSAMTARLLRSSLLESMASDYIKTAKAKGLSESKIMRRHALKNALLPVVTIVFLQAGALLTGAILTEAVFSWPGLGSLIVDALGKRDYPTIQGCVLFIAFVYMLMTLISDIVYALIDPRIRYKEGV